MDVIVYKVGFWVALLIMAASMTGYALRDDNNSNSTPKDTIIIEPYKETPTKPPAITPTPVKVQKPITVVTPAPPPEPVTPIVVEDEYQQAKERQQQEQLEDLNKQEEPVQESEPASEPQPINVNSVVDQDGYVYIGIENAGRQVTVTGA